MSARRRKRSGSISKASSEHFATIRRTHQPISSDARTTFSTTCPRIIARCFRPRRLGRPSHALAATRAGFDQLTHCRRFQALEEAIRRNDIFLTCIWQEGARFHDCGSLTTTTTSGAEAASPCASGIVMSVSHPQVLHCAALHRRSVCRARATWTRLGLRCVRSAPRQVTLSGLKSISQRIGQAYSRRSACRGPWQPTTFLHLAPWAVCARLERGGAV